MCHLENSKHRKYRQCGTSGKSSYRLSPCSCEEIAGYKENNITLTPVLTDILDISETASVSFFMEQEKVSNSTPLNSLAELV
jgi:hypothetical protein